MARLRYNLLETTLDGGIGTGTTVLVFGSALQEYGVDIPTIANGDYLPLVMGEEIMYLIDYQSGSTSGTVIRGAEDSIATTHAHGARIYAAPTKRDVPEWVTALSVRPSVPDADDDEFEGSTRKPAWTSVVPTGTLTHDVYWSTCTLRAASQASSDVAGMVKPIRSGLAGAGVAIEIASKPFTTTDNYLMLGPIFARGTDVNSTAIWQMTYTTGASAILDLRSGTYTNINSDHSSPGSTLAGWTGGAPLLYQRLEFSPTNGFRQMWSPDGRAWTQFGGGWVANPIGGAPTHYGIGISTWGSGTERLAAVEYFRVTAL